MSRSSRLTSRLEYLITRLNFQWNSFQTTSRLVYDPFDSRLFHPFTRKAASVRFGVKGHNCYSTTKIMMWNGSALHVYGSVYSVHVDVPLS